MTREAALESLRRIALRLPGDESGVRKLLERISVAEDAEALRDRLAELGAQSLLEAR